MKKMGLDFRTRLINMVTDQKTVIAFMEDKLDKDNFRVFFHDASTFAKTDKIVFDFESGFVNLFRFDTKLNDYVSMKESPVPFIDVQRQVIFDAIGWEDDPGE